MDDQEGSPSSSSKRTTVDDDGRDRKLVKTNDDAQTQQQKPPALDTEAIKQELTCNICLDLATRATTVLPCVHHFCWSCVKEWYTLGRNKCPRCQTVTTEAKVNAALINICDLIIQAEPDAAKPAEVLAEEATAFQTYKVAHAGSTTLRPSASRYGYQAEDDDDEDDVPAFWRCPCCDPNNPFGYVCERPFPEAENFGRAMPPRPPRGAVWPDLNELEDFMPEITERHTSCEECTCWIPENGPSEATCIGCHNSICTPYDPTGYCPKVEHPWTTMENHSAVEQALTVAPQEFIHFNPRFNTVERKRVHEYWTEYGITPRQIFDQFVQFALTLCDGVADEDGVVDVRKARQEQAEREAKEEDQSPEAVERRRKEARHQAMANVYPEYGEWICWSSNRVVELEAPEAHAFLCGNLCGGCATQALSHVVDWWWDDVRKNKRDTLKAEIRDLPDCWYGVECRTQHHNPEHCEKYNHLCPKTGKPADQQQDDPQPPAAAADAQGQRDDDQAPADQPAAAVAAQAEGLDVLDAIAINAEAEAMLAAQAEEEDPASPPAAEANDIQAQQPQIGAQQPQAAAVPREFIVIDDD